MKKKKNPMLDEGMQIKSDYKLTVKKPDRSATEIGNHKSNLYDSSSIDTDSALYNTQTPGISQLDKSNMSTSPALLAIGSKARKIRSTIGPSVVKPSLNSIRVPISKDLNSLLTKKPLSDLQDPKKRKIATFNHQNEVEKMGIMFKDNPFAYFIKHKDGMGHQFIYLKYSKSRNDPHFSPYDLTKTAFCEAGEDYFTMSANAITHVDENGNTETLSLDDWTKEETDFSSIRRLRIFKTYLFWKPFKVWRTYVQRQRYKETARSVKLIPLMYNTSIAKSSMAFSMLTRQIDKIIDENILALIYQSKYTIKLYLEQCEVNQKNLKEQYNEFISVAISKISELYDFLNDPKNLAVHEGDFDEIKRKNPNIMTLIFLEQKKEEQRLKQVDKTKEELTFLPNFIRMIDYMFLESICKGCYKGWKLARDNIKSESSAIFTVEISFDDSGNVAFIPDCETLVKCVIDSMNENLKTLENLPRVLFASEVQKMISNTETKQEYPTLNEYFCCSPYLESIKNEIIDIFNKSYEEATKSSSSFCDYYPLYKLSQGWNVRNYIKTPSGQLYQGSLNINDKENEEFDSFLTNYDNEPVINISEVRVDVQKLIHENERLVNIRNGFTSGAIFIDSYPLKAKLKPIPLKSLTEIEETLNDLVHLKIEQMNRAFKNYSVQMKAKSTTLDVFVDFCSLLKKIQNFLPKMNSIIASIDEIIALFEVSHFRQLNNPLHDFYAAFKDEVQDALQLKKSQYDPYLLELKQLKSKLLHKMEKYYHMSKLIPRNIPEFNYDSFSIRTSKLKEKIKKIKDSIKNCIKYQSVLEVGVSTFDQYKESKHYIKLSENLLILYKEYDEIIKLVENVPFDQVNIEIFRKKSNQLADQIAKIDLILDGKACSLYREITKSYMEFSPYIDELSILSNGKLQERHWNQLFEECGKKGSYNDQITINDLIKLNIIGNIERIKKITAISLGEFQLEEEVKRIRSYWSEVHIPLANAHAKTDMTMVLAPLDSLISGINDATITLHQILDSPFVSGIQKEVEELTKKMDKIIDICKVWQIFQNNWITVSNLYQQEAISKAIPHQQQRFLTIKRKWRAIVRHVWSNTRLFAVCQFESLLEDLQDNSNDLEIIMKDLVLYVNQKRNYIPRLYFLSDQELLTMMSTTSFSIFMSLFLKTLMHITRLDSHSKDAAQLTSQDSTKELCNFSGLTIFSIVGEDGDCLPLADHILCTGPLESWAPSIFTSIEESFKDHFKESYESYENLSFEDFVVSNSSYIGLLVLSSIFTNNVDECFARLETNQRSFIMYEQQLIEKETKLIRSLSSPISPSELLKISNSITIINMYIERIHSYQDKIQNYSFKMKWNSVLKHRYNPTTDTLFCEFSDYQFHHGLEYWGLCPRLVISTEIDSVMYNMGESISSFGIPMLYGPFKSGKSTLIKYFALMFGHYYYEVQPFPDLSKYLIDQILIGAMESNSWIYFHNVHEINVEKLEYLFDQIRNLTSIQSSKCNEYQFNKTTKIKIGQSTRFFLSKTIEGEIPPPLKSFTRPVSLRIPSFTKMIEIQLMATGYKSSKHIAPKLNTFLNSITTILKLHLSILSYSMNILKDGYEYLSQMIHQNRCSFINYYEEARTAEEFSIAIGCYNNMKFTLNEEEIEILIQTLYSHFTLFDEYWIFKSYIQKPNSFIIDRIESAIQSFLNSRILEMKIDLPFNYLSSKVVDLFRLMRNHTAVVVCGPPDTGKSLIIQLLFESIEMLVKDKEMSNVPGILPIKEARCFNGSGSWTDEFGLFEYIKNLEKDDDLYLNRNHSKDESKSDDKNDDKKEKSIFNDEVNSDQFKAKYVKQRFINGEITSAMRFLSRYADTHHRILYLDGPIDTRLSNFLIDCTIDQSKVQFATFDSYQTKGSLHIILETENVSDASPSFMAVCGVLSMRNCQFIHAPLHSILELDLLYPSIPFTTASLKHPSINKICLYSLNSLFCEMAPYIIRQVQLIPKNIDIFQLISKYSNLAVDLALTELTENGYHDQEDPDIFKMAVIFGMFRVFHSIIVPSQISSFDEFLRRTFSIQLPEEWVGFGVPNSYWSTFPTPSILSMRIWNKRVNPHNFNLLSSPPIPNGYSITVIVPQYLPNLTTFQLGLKSGHHFLIIGEQYSGKESFIQVCLSQNSNLIPIHFYLTPCSTSRDLRGIILKQSQIVTSEMKKPGDPTLFALIFHHLDNCKLEVFEFIRMLIISKNLPLISNYDPKVYDKFNLSKFVVIATGVNPSSFPSRFLNLFTPLLMQNYVQLTKDYILTKIMEHESVHSKFISLVCYSLKELDLTFGKILQIVKVICMMPEHSSDNSLVKMLTIFMSEIQYIVFNDDAEGFSKYQKDVLQICKGLELEKVFQEYQNEKELLIPKISANNKLELRKVNFSELKESLTNLSGRKFTNLEVKQYIYLSHSISRIKSHCEICGPTSSGKMSLIKFYSIRNKIKMIDISYSSQEMLKNALVDVILSNKQQLIVFRVTKDSVQILSLLYTLIVRKHYKLVFNEEEQEELYRNLSMKECPTEIQRRDADLTILKNIENNCHLIIITESEMNLPSIEMIKIKCDSKHHICDEILTEDLISMKSLFCKIADKVSECLPFSHQNQFYDFINLFAETIKIETKNLKIRNDKIKLALAFYNKIFIEHQSASSKMDGLKPLVEKIKLETKNIQEELKQKKEYTTERRNKLNEEMMLRCAQLNQKKQEFNDADVELQSNVVKFEIIKQKIASLSESDCQQLRIFVAAPTPFVKMLNEISSLITNRPKNSKILSNDELPKILTSDEVNYSNYSEKTVTELKKYFNSESTLIDKKQVESSPPIISMLLNYYQNIYQMAHKSNVCKAKQEVIEQCRKSNDEFNEQMNKELESIKEIESTFGGLRRDLEDHQNQLEEMKVEYKQNKAEKRVMDQILKDSTTLFNEWKTEADDYQTLCNALNGDTIILTSYIIYAGMLPAEKRSNLIDRVYEILISENISVSFTNPIEFIETKLHTTKMPVEIDATSLPQSLLIDFHHLAVSVRVPLVIDLDGLVLHCLKSSGKFIEVSLNSLSFLKVASEVFQSNKYLAVTDADRLTPVLMQIINGNKIIQFEDREITRNPEFKIFLFTTNTKIYEFDPDLMSRVSVIDTTKSSLEGVKTKIIYSFLDYYDPDLIPRLTEIEKLEISNKEEISSYENAALDAFATISEKQQEDGEYSYLKDEEIVPSFVRAKDCYMTFNIQTDSNNLKKELEMTIKHYQSLIDICFNFWHILTRYIRKVSPSIIKLNDFLNTISSASFNFGSHSLTTEQVQSFQPVLINSLYQLIFPSLSYNEILVFVFLAGFFNHKNEPSEFDKIIEHISSEYDSKANFDSIQIDAVNLIVENLKYTSIDHVFELVFKFNCDVMGRDFLNYLPHFNIDNALSSQVTILYSDGNKEPTELLCQFVIIRNMKENFSMISLNKSTIKPTRKLILRGMKEGLWIVVNYSRVSIESSLLLNEIPSLFRMASSIHENFKLILNCRTTEYLSFELMEIAKFIRIDSFPSIRRTMQEIYYHHSASMKLFDSSSSAKKMAYLSALIFSQIQYRNFLRPCGFNFLLPPSIWSFQQITEMIGKLIDMQEIPLFTFKDFLEFIFFSSSVIENNDKLELKSIVSSFITSNSLDDGFNFLSSESNEFEHWVVPNKASLQNYILFISKLPSFADSDILGMSKKTADSLLNWNLSRYVSRTFKKLNECNKSLLSKDYNLDNYTKSSNEETEKTEEEYENLRQRIIQQIPSKITTDDILSEISPVLQFWLNEANSMNKFIDQVINDLTVKKIRIVEGIVPEKWHKYKPVQQMPRFLTYLNDKRSFILKYLRKNDEIDDEIDISLITNVREFFNAYMADYAYKKKINISSLYYDFSFGEGNEHQSIVIKNLVMMNGRIENNFLIPSDTPFNKLPKLYCKITKRNTNNISANPSKSSKTFVCPIYKYIFDPQLTAPHHFLLNNEIINNFVIDVPIKSEIAEKTWIMNGTSIFCNMPAQFVPV